MSLFSYVMSILMSLMMLSNDLCHDHHVRGKRPPAYRGGAERRGRHHRTRRTPRHGGAGRQRGFRPRQLLSYAGRARASPSCRTSTCTSSPARRWASSAARARAKSHAWCSLISTPVRRHRRAGAASAGDDVREYDLEALRDRGRGRAAEERAVLRHDPGKPPLGQRGGHGRRSCRCMSAVLLCADDFIQASAPTGYDTYIEQGGTNVSGGQQQRLCIARALLKEAEGADPRRLRPAPSIPPPEPRASREAPARGRSLDTTKLIVAQRISSVRDADRILVLDGGPRRRLRPPTSSLLANSNPHLSARSIEGADPGRRRLRPDGGRTTGDETDARPRTGARSTPRNEPPVSSFGKTMRRTVGAAS